MTNAEVLKEYNTEKWVIEEVLQFLLLEYRDATQNGRPINTVGFVKDFMKQETYASVEYAEKSKMDRVESNVIDVVDADVREIEV